MPLMRHVGPGRRSASRAGPSQHASAVARALARDLAPPRRGGPAITRRSPTVAHRLPPDPGRWRIRTAQSADCAVRICAHGRRGDRRGSRQAPAIAAGGAAPRAHARVGRCADFGAPKPTAWVEEAGRETRRICRAAAAALPPPGRGILRPSAVVTRDISRLNDGHANRFSPAACATVCGGQRGWRRLRSHGKRGRCAAAGPRRSLARARCLEARRGPCPGGRKRLAP